MTFVSRWEVDMKFAGFPQFEVNDEHAIWRVFFMGKVVATVELNECRARGMRYRPILDGLTHADCSSITSALQIIENHITPQLPDPKNGAELIAEAEKRNLNPYVLGYMIEKGLRTTKHVTSWVEFTQWNDARWAEHPREFDPGTKWCVITPTVEDAFKRHCQVIMDHIKKVRAA